MVHIQNFYIEGYIKPGSNVKMDLSNLAGYGNNQLPAGTKIRVLSWKGYSTIPVYQLPGNIKDNFIKVSKDPTNFNVPSSQKVYEENIFKFYSNGKCKMISTTPCTLCKICSYTKKT